MEMAGGWVRVGPASRGRAPGRLRSTRDGGLPPTGPCTSRAPVRVAVAVTPGQTGGPTLYGQPGAPRELSGPTKGCTPPPGRGGLARAGRAPRAGRGERPRAAGGVGASASWWRGRAARGGDRGRLQEAGGSRRAGGLDGSTGPGAT